MIRSGGPAVHKWLLGASAGFLLGFLTIYGLMRSGTQLEGASEHRRSFNGEEVAVIFIGASTCGVCALPELPGHVFEAMDSVKAIATRTGRGFIRIGISLDGDPQAGLELLDRYGPFDVVSTGGGWVNDLAVRYLHRDFPGVDAIPQVLVTTRVLDGPPVAPYRLYNERLVHRVVGADGLRSWLDRGTPLELSPLLLLEATP